jgi:hypothetical protein
VHASESLVRESHCLPAKPADAKAENSVTQQDYRGLTSEAANSRLVPGEASPRARNVSDDPPAASAPVPDQIMTTTVHLIIRSGQAVALHRKVSRALCSRTASSAVSCTGDDRHVGVRTGASPWFAHVDAIMDFAPAKAARERRLVPENQTCSCMQELENQPIRGRGLEKPLMLLRT